MVHKALGKIVHRGGPNKEARVKRAVRDYLAMGRYLSAKVRESLLALCNQPVDAAHWERLEYFHRMLDKHLDLGQRRLLNEETIPAHEKVFSLFEPHTEWIAKGKQRPNMELGHRLLVATDQDELVQDYAVVVGRADVDQSVPVADRLLGRYGCGQIARLSFDKGFTRARDRDLLSLYVPMLAHPNRTILRLKRHDSCRTGLLVSSGAASGCPSHRLGSRPFPRQQFPPDPMQVVTHHPAPLSKTAVSGQTLMSRRRLRQQRLSC